MIDTWISARAQLLDDIEVVDSRLALLIKPLCDVSLFSFMRPQVLLIVLFDGLLRGFHLSLLLLSPLSFVLWRNRGGCRAHAGQVFLLLLLLLISVDMMWTRGGQLLGLILCLRVRRRNTAITIHVYRRLRFLARCTEPGRMPRRRLFRFEWVRSYSLASRALIIRTSLLL